MTLYVKVDLGGRAYTYSWDGPPLSPGDLVVIPGNSVRPEPSEAPVLRLLDRPDYDPDKIAAILSRADYEDLLAEDGPCCRYCGESGGDCLGPC